MTEVLVRGIVENKKGEILVCRKKTKNYYFFPGGHVEFGESNMKALKREFKEELNVEIEKASFIGGSNHVFIEENKKRHEINLFYNLEISELKSESCEDHIDFFWFTKDKLKKETVFPEPLKQGLLEWFEDQKVFWKDEKNLE